MQQAQFDDRLSIKDLDGVRVAVEDPLPSGFSSAQIVATIEGQLRRAGIRVLGMGEFPTGDPHLRVTVSAAATSGIAAVDVQVDFVQIVFLRRNPAVTFNRAQTWKAAAQLVMGTASDIMPAVERELARQVDQFVADYRAINLP
jgi:hypothetical protein